MNSKIKGAARSKTVWFNSVAGTLLVALPEMKEALPALQQFITPQVYRWLILVVVIGNIWLRAITTIPLEDKSP
jgi:hypothetical protein